MALQHLLTQSIQQAAEQPRINKALLDQLAAQVVSLTQLASLFTSSSFSPAARLPHDGAFDHKEDEAPDDDLFREANDFQGNESGDPCVPANTIAAAVNAGLLELLLFNYNRHTFASSTPPKAVSHCFWRIKDIPKTAHGYSLGKRFRKSPVPDLLQNLTEIAMYSQALCMEQDTEHLQII